MGDWKVLLAVAALSAVTASCGGTTTLDRSAVVDHPGGPDAGDASSGGRGGARNGTGGHAAADGGANTGGRSVTTPMDASNAEDVPRAPDADSAADSAVSLCAPPIVTPGPDAGRCLGIFYATIARVDLWIDDASAPAGGTRITLASGDTKTVGGHTYGYSGNSLITSGSRVDLFLDVDGKKDAIELHLGGCAPQVGPHAWDYPASFERTPCSGCPLTSIARNYTVVESPAEGGAVMFYTFTADGPPRTCDASIDLLGFTTAAG